jgi:hypothetical protein
MSHRQRIVAKRQKAAWGDGQKIEDVAGGRRIPLME